MARIPLLSVMFAIALVSSAALKKGCHTFEGHVFHMQENTVVLSQHQKMFKCFPFLINCPF